MGWWKIGNRSNRFMGDETADDVLFSLNIITDLYENRQQDLPTFADYISEIGNAVIYGEHSVEDESVTTTVADFLNLLPNNHSKVSLLPDAEKALNEMLRRIQNTYKQSIERNPFFIEIIANILFGLAVTPEKYVSDQTGLLEIKKIILADPE